MTETSVVGIVGVLAAIFSTTSFAPQAWKIIRTRDTSSISRRMYVVTVTGFALWLAYGLLRWDWHLVVPNAICLVLSGFILTMTLLPRRRSDKVAAALDPTDSERPDHSAPAARRSSTTKWRAFGR